MTQEDPDRRNEPLKVAFSLPQLAGSALAAATAALIGSQLGVAGTIAGAAVASVVGGVAGTLYSAGLDRTHRRVTEAIRRGYERVREADDGETQVLPAATNGEGETEWNRPHSGSHSVPVSEEDAVETTAVDLRPVPAADEPTRPSRRRKFLIGTAVSVATIFVATMVMITIVEFGIGRSLDGSSTTTVGGARRPTAAATTPKPKPTPTPSPSASASATTAAPASPTPEPTPSASASEQITVEPTPSPSVVLTPAATSS